MTFLKKQGKWFAFLRTLRKNMVRSQVWCRSHQTATFCSGMREACHGSYRPRWYHPSSRYRAQSVGTSSAATCRGGHRAFRSAVRSSDVLDASKTSLPPYEVFSTTPYHNTTLSNRLKTAGAPQ
jgi:hypothetical protein